MGFLQKYRHMLVGLGFLLAALQLPIYLKQDRSLNLPGRILFTLAYYPQKAWAMVTDGAGTVIDRYIYLVDTESDNIALREEVAVLRGHLQQANELEQENIRLRKLLNMRQRNEYQATAARVIALDSSSWFRSFTIDAGSKDGIERGMPVVTHQGVVGTVVSVASRSSKVLPLVDVHSSIEVTVSRSRARAMLVGRGDAMPTLDYLERAADVRPGDLLVTSGLAGTFPEGFPVGIVREVRQKTYGLFQNSYVEPNVDFAKLENVLVLHYREGERLSDYQPPATEPTAAEPDNLLVKKSGEPLRSAESAPAPAAQLVRTRAATGNTADAAAGSARPQNRATSEPAVQNPPKPKPAAPTPSEPRASSPAAPVPNPQTAAPADKAAPEKKPSPAANPPASTVSPRPASTGPAESGRATPKTEERKPESSAAEEAPLQRMNSPLEPATRQTTGATVKPQAPGAQANEKAVSLPSTSSTVDTE